MLHQILEQRKLTTGIVITFQVMTFPGMSPGYPDAVSALPKCGQEELGAHPAGAGDADHPDVGGVLHAADAGQVGGAVAAPVA